MRDQDSVNQDILQYDFKTVKFSLSGKKEIRKTWMQKLIQEVSLYYLTSALLIIVVIQIKWSQNPDPLTFALFYQKLCNAESLFDWKN